MNKKNKSKNKKKKNVTSEELFKQMQRVNESFSKAIEKAAEDKGINVKIEGSFPTWRIDVNKNDNKDN